MDTLTIAPGQTYDLLFKQQYPGKWLIHCHMFVHSHMSADEHPPGESGMNGMVAVLEVSPASSGSGLDFLPISSVGPSDVELLGVVGIAGVLAVARRRHRLSLPPTQNTRKDN
jgi:hypothetical protein